MKKSVLSQEAKNKFLVETRGLSNLKLLQDYTGLSCGDDYEGCFTKEGVWQLAILKTELFKRLKACGFIQASKR